MAYNNNEWHVTTIEGQARMGCSGHQPARTFDFRRRRRLRALRDGVTISRKKTRNTPGRFLEILKSSYYDDVRSSVGWPLTPPELVQAQLKLAVPAIGACRKEKFRWGAGMIHATLMTIRGK